MKKVLLYLNQFFAGIGGEDMADVAPEFREDIKGPALAYQSMLKDSTIIGAIICGDNYMGSNTEKALAEIDSLLEGKEFDILLAGPAFQAGRYGVACGNVAKHIQEKYGIPAITSMHEENPGVEMFKQDVYIMPGGKSAASMKKDIEKIVGLAHRILAGEKRILQEEGGFFVRGIRHQVWLPDGRPAVDRAIDMILKKVKGEEFISELPINLKERVPVAPAIKDLSKANIAMITTGGIVPVDNPDRIQSASATRWGRYDISQLDRLAGGEFKTIHAGFDPAAADADPNVIMPIDAMKHFEKEAFIGKLHPWFYSTVGTGTTENEAARMANEMIPYLKEDGVDAIIMTST
jgi:glycine reductase